MPVEQHGNNNTIELNPEGNPDIESRLQLYIQGDNNKVSIHSGLKGRGHVKITILASNCSVVIGKNVQINQVLDIVVIPAGGGTPSHDCHVDIGDDCLFNGVSNLILAESGNRIRLGTGCLLGHAITFNTSDSHPIYALDGNARINPSADITLGDRVWVGHNAHFLKKSLVSDDSVVAAHAIVSRKFEQRNVVIAGNPAQVVKQGIRWEKTAPP